MKPLDERVVEEIITEFKIAERKDKGEIIDGILDKYDLKTRASLITFCFVLKQIGFTPDDIIHHLFYSECSRTLQEYGHNFSAKINTFYLTFPKEDVKKIADVIYKGVKRSRSLPDSLSISLKIIYGTNIPNAKKEEAVDHLKSKYEKSAPS